MHSASRKSNIRFPFLAHCCVMFTRDVCVWSIPNVGCHSCVRAVLVVYARKKIMSQIVER